MRRRGSADRRELWRVQRRLKRLNHEKVATVNLAARRTHALREIAATIAEHHLTTADIAAIDTIVDGYAAGWWQSVERRGHAGRAALDHLEAEVTSLVARLEERVEEERGLLSEIQGVAANVWDQVGDPEQPNLDPLR